MVNMMLNTTVLVLRSYSKYLQCKVHFYLERSNSTEFVSTHNGDAWFGPKCVPFCTALCHLCILPCRRWTHISVSLLYISVYFSKLGWAFLISDHTSVCKPHIFSPSHHARTPRNSRLPAHIIRTVACCMYIINTTTILLHKCTPSAPILRITVVHLVVCGCLFSEGHDILVIAL